VVSLTPSSGGVGEKEFDIRISTLPTMYGEKAVMRLLDKSSVLMGMEELGFSPGTLQKFRKIISRPYGLVLVTGPTGSGKTTTLYAALNTLNSIEKNIVTIEDPVEYQLTVVNQVQVNPKAGVTFVSGLRSILRQDPDIIMVGEIRDVETATIAIQSALTGHLVFSTLHTNDSAGAVARLVDMGIEPFLIASSLIAIVAQRLVRKVCAKCKEPQEKLPVSALENLSLPKSVLESLPSEIVLYKGRGCEFCNQTGYKGRVGIHEVMEVSETIRDAIVNKTGANKIREMALKEGMPTMRQSCFQKLARGITSLEEMYRLTAES
jgi:type IV pilus assembly protein PilB